MSNKDDSMKKADGIDEEFLKKGIGKVTKIQESFSWHEEKEERNK